ncbi:glycosyltransferase family 2 protein [bacterium]|nr:glycosyltransferase family 2 protein [bacterium]MBU1651559.1 glycosyltransferase family 2 protein [bacterium]MBU1882274.1 glycosyltransferase family 2 protein [bacterium]
MSQCRVSIVIPHLKDLEILKDCLTSIYNSDFLDFEVILVDNASTDGSSQAVVKDFPDVRCIRLVKNLGYAGGCNVGIEASKAEFVLLLNDDAVIEPNTIGDLVAALEADSQVAAAQPKLLNIKTPTHFDYAGACGGLIDIFGYPFAFGRTFMVLEKDEGQFDTPSEIFWACGTCVIFRRSILSEVGLLDEDFFAHMEEIDLAWRIHLAGYKLIRVPQAVVYHFSGHTLPNTQSSKMYLNHRNSIVCLLKNYQWAQLVWILPLRIVLEWGTIIASFLRGDFRRGPAALKVQLFLPILLYKSLSKRSGIQKLRRVSDRQIMKKMYWGSVVFQHFVFGKTKTAQILHQNEL